MREDAENQIAFPVKELASGASGGVLVLSGNVAIKDSTAQGGLP